MDRREHMHEMEEVRAHLRDAEEKLRERDDIIQTLRLRVEEEETRANAAEEERDHARHGLQDVRAELGEEKRSADMAIKRLEALAQRRKSQRNLYRRQAMAIAKNHRAAGRHINALRTAVREARRRAHEAEDTRDTNYDEAQRLADELTVALGDRAVARVEEDAAQSLARQWEARCTIAEQGMERLAKAASDVSRLADKATWRARALRTAVKAARARAQVAEREAEHVYTSLVDQLQNSLHDAKQARDRHAHALQQARHHAECLSGALARATFQAVERES